MCKITVAHIVCLPQVAVYSCFRGDNSAAVVPVVYHYIVVPKRNDLFVSFSLQAKTNSVTY